MCASIMSVKGAAIVFDSFEDLKSEVPVSENQHYEHYQHFVDFLQPW